MLGLMVVKLSGYWTFRRWTLTTVALQHDSLTPTLTLTNVQCLNVQYPPFLTYV